MSNIEDLKEELEEIGLLDSMSMVLRWDQQTYMPDEAMKFRSEQMSYMDMLIHRRKTSDGLEKKLSKFLDLETGDIQGDGLSEDEQSLLKETYRDYDHAKSLPTDFIGKFSEAGSQSVQAWKEAKEEDDFKVFLPHLKEMVELSKQKAEYIGYEDKPLDALIDVFEPGMTTERIMDLFQPLKRRLDDLTERISKSEVNIDGSPLNGNFPEDKQYEFTCDLLEGMGFDFDRGRQDDSAHPFTMGFHPSDTRVTNRFDESRIASSVGSAIHEGGHALYEQGLDPEEFGNPLGEAISFGIHESQSRLWENLVGASRSFWSFWFLKLQEYFPNELEGVTLDEWYRAYNKVEPSLVRVESDEVHYNLHILLRFEIEDRLINEGMDPEKVPELWNEKMSDYIGITPEGDAEGPLQDIHWSWGQFGYFPSYSLGNFFSVQIFNQAKRELPGLKEDFKAGKFGPLKEWLNENVHEVGCRYKAAELIERLTGKEPSSEPFLDYLEEKYSRIYEL